MTWHAIYGAGVLGCAQAARLLRDDDACHVVFFDLEERVGELHRFAELHKASEPTDDQRVDDERQDFWNDPVLKNEKEVAEVLSENRDRISVAISGEGWKTGNFNYVWVCVPTPLMASHRLMRLDMKAVRDVVKHVRSNDSAVLIFVRSTTNPDFWNEPLVAEDERVLCFPEFLVEGFAMDGTSILQPLGLHERVLRDEIVEIQIPAVGGVRRMTRAEAATAKLVVNSMLAAKLTLLNEIALVASSMGLEPANVLAPARSDSRLGIGYDQACGTWGGTCLPKDAAAFASLSLEKRASGALKWLGKEATSPACFLEVHGKINEFLSRDVKRDMRGVAVLVTSEGFKASHSSKRGSRILEIAEIAKSAVTLRQEKLVSVEEAGTVIVIAGPGFTPTDLRKLRWKITTDKRVLYLDFSGCSTSAVGRERIEMIGWVYSLFGS